MTDEHRQWLEALPSAAMYERSYMHRDRVTHVAASRRDFFITASVDGVVKFWKKQEKGVEFVKQFRAHLGPVTDVTVSATGAHCATCSVADKTIKVFDVLGFDMFKMLRLGHSPGRLAFIGRGVDSQNLLAVADAGGPTVHVFDINSEGQDPTAALNAKGGAGGNALMLKRFEEMDWDRSGQISFMEFLFALEDWVGMLRGTLLLSRKGTRRRYGTARRRCARVRGRAIVSA